MDEAQPVLNLISIDVSGWYGRANLHVEDLIAAGSNYGAEWTALRFWCYP